MLSPLLIRSLNIELGLRSVPPYVSLLIGLHKRLAFPSTSQVSVDSDLTMLKAAANLGLKHAQAVLPSAYRLQGRPVPYQVDINSAGCYLSGSKTLMTVLGLLQVAFARPVKAAAAQISAMSTQPSSPAPTEAGGQSRALKRSRLSFEGKVDLRSSKSALSRQAHLGQLSARREGGVWQNLYPDIKGDWPD